MWDGSCFPRWVRHVAHGSWWRRWTDCCVYGAWRHRNEQCGSILSCSQQIRHSSLLWIMPTVRGVTLPEISSTLHVPHCPFPLQLKSFPGSGHVRYRGGYILMSRHDEWKENICALYSMHICCHDFTQRQCGQTDSVQSDVLQNLYARVLPHFIWHNAEMNRTAVRDFTYHSKCSIHPLYSAACRCAKSHSCPKTKMEAMEAPVSKTCSIIWGLREGHAGLWTTMQGK